MAQAQGLDWQPDYRDLSDEHVLRFEAWCIVCGARYAMPDESLDPLLLRVSAPGAAPAEEIEQLKQERFASFDGAFRELSIPCAHCQRRACPDCWDTEHRMCVPCALECGYERISRRVAPLSEPLVDGRLERIAPGRYSASSLPRWVGNLSAPSPEDALALSGLDAGGSDGGMVTPLILDLVEREIHPLSNPSRASSPASAPSPQMALAPTDDVEGLAATMARGGASGSMRYSPPLQSVWPNVAFGAVSYASQGAGAASAHAAHEPASPHRSGVAFGEALSLAHLLLDRLLTLIVVVVVLALIVGIAAAELSPQADAALKSLIHVDIRAMLAQFGAEMTQIAQKLRH